MIDVWLRRAALSIWIKTVCHLRAEVRSDSFSQSPAVILSLKASVQKQKNRQYSHIAVRPVTHYCIMTNDFLLAAVVRNALNTKTQYRTEASDLNASAWSVSIRTLDGITVQETQRVSFKLAHEGCRLFQSWQNDIRRKDGDVLFKAELCSEQLLCLRITGGCLCYEVINADREKEVEKHICRCGRYMLLESRWKRKQWAYR